MISFTRSVPLLQTSLPGVFTTVRLKAANRIQHAKSTLEISSWILLVSPMTGSGDLYLLLWAMLSLSTLEQA